MEMSGKTEEAVRMYLDSLQSVSPDLAATLTKNDIKAATDKAAAALTEINGKKFISKEEVEKIAQAYDADIEEVEELLEEKSITVVPKIEVAKDDGTKKTTKELYDEATKELGTYKGSLTEMVSQLQTCLLEQKQYMMIKETVVQIMKLLLKI